MGYKRYITGRRGRATVGGHMILKRVGHSLQVSLSKRSRHTQSSEASRPVAAFISDALSESGSLQACRPPKHSGATDGERIAHTHPMMLR